MGALARRARRTAGCGSQSSPTSLVASIFVNPLQFGAGEDLDRYPRTFDADLELCAAQGVDVVFAPSVDEVYPGGDPQVTVDPGPRGDILEGASRPGHFRGVLTVVAKLFGLVQPDVAVFGEKDYQQLALITRMVRDLCMPIEVVGAPTVREADGLAMSSRNRYLDPDATQAAVALSRALFAGTRRRRRRTAGRPRRRSGRARCRARRGAGLSRPCAGPVLDARPRVGAGAAAGRGASRGDPTDRQRRGRAAMSRPRRPMSRDAAGHRRAEHPHDGRSLLRCRQLVSHWRVSTDPRRTADEWGLLFDGSARRDDRRRSRSRIDGSRSVRPYLRWWLSCARWPPTSSRDATHVFVGPGVRSGLPMLMDNPREVGTDRVANVVGAVERFGAPCLVVDMGTATTFDAVNPAGQFVGGAIAPGIQVSLEALGRPRCAAASGRAGDAALGDRQEHRRGVAGRLRLRLRQPGRRRGRADARRTRPRSAQAAPS